MHFRILRISGFDVLQLMRRYDLIDGAGRRDRNDLEDQN